MDRRTPWAVGDELDKLRASMVTEDKPEGPNIFESADLSGLPVEAKVSILMDVALDFAGKNPIKALDLLANALANTHVRNMTSTGWLRRRLHTLDAARRAASCLFGILRRFDRRARGK